MKRCVIITGYIEGSIRKICPDLFTVDSDSSANIGIAPDPPLILCADGGYRLAQKEGLIPHVIIGDFDTFDDQTDDHPKVRGFLHDAGQIIRVPVMKDDTDTMLCIKYGLEQRCNSFLIVGGIGGRLDHTFANLQTLAYLAQRGADVCMKDEENCVIIKTPGAILLHRSEAAATGNAFRPYRRFSLFSWSPACDGLSIRGAKYPLENGRLESSFPLGVSNEFESDEVQIEFTSGMLLIIMNHQR